MNLVAPVLLAGGLLLVARSTIAATVNQEVEPFLQFEPSGLVEPLNWNTIEFFSPDEFGEALPDVNPSIIIAADELRRRIGCPLAISPAAGAIARYDEASASSRHYAVGRLSDALDLMPDGCSLETVLNAAQGIPAIGGFGAYPDWSPRPGVHIDGRARVGGRLATWMGFKQRNASTGKLEQVYGGIDARRLA